MRIILSILFCFAYLLGFSQVKNKQMETSASPTMFLMTKNDATLGNVRQFVTASEAADTLNANFSFNNIYNIDGTLTGTRSLSLAGYDLTFLQSGIGDVVFYGNNSVWTNYTNSHQAKIGSYNSGTFVGSESASPFEFIIGNTAQAIIESDGDAYYYNDLGVGISPVYALDVVGEFRLNNATEGIDRVLRSDANGLASWVDLGTLGGGTDDQTLQEVLTSGNDAGGLDAMNFAEVEADEFIGDLRGAVLFKAQAGENLAKGQVVYVSGISGNTTIVSKADADDAAKMPGFGVVAASANSGNPVDIYTFGTLSNLNTLAFSLGDILYISTTAGQLTAIPPTGESALIQNIAKVTRVDNSAGSIKISGAGRTNATPNLNTGRLFVGNASNQAVADGTIYVDIANSRVGIGTSTPDEKLEIEGGDIHIDQSTNAYLRIDRSATNRRAELQFETAGSDNWVIGAVDSDDHSGAGDGSELFIGTSSGGGAKLWIENNGNVGIGTSSPDATLRIDNSSGRALKVTGGFGTANPIAEFVRDDVVNDKVYISANGSEPQISFLQAEGGSANDWSIGTGYEGSFEIADNTYLGTNTRFVINNTGDVEIATVNTDNTTDDVLVHSSDGTVSKRTLTSIGDEIDLNLGDDNLTLTGFRTVNLSNNDLQFQMNGTGVGHGGFWYLDASANSLNNYSADNGAGGNYGFFSISNPSSGFDLVERFNFFGGDGTSNYNIRIFDQTSTTGAKEVRIYNGALRLYDSGSASDIYLNPDGSSYIVNNLAIGSTSTPNTFYVDSPSNIPMRVDGGNNSFITFITNTEVTPNHARIGFAADDMEVWTNGVERFHISGTGSVGINTSSPAKQLEIENTGAAATMLIQTTDDQNAYIEYQNNSGGGGLIYRTGVTTLEHWDISSDSQVMLRLDRANNRVQVIDQELRVSSTGSEHVFFNTDNWGIRDQFANLKLYFDASSSNPLGTTMTTYNNDLYWVFDSATDDYRLRTGSYDNLKYEKTTGTVGEYFELGFDELKVYSETDFFTLTKVDHTGGFPETASFEFTDGGYIRTSTGIEHKADSDTEMFFSNDIIRFYAGGYDLLHLEERAGLVNRVVINENSTACEFRVESDTDANAIFMDGTSGDIGFGTNTPSAELDVVGDTELNGDLLITDGTRIFKITQNVNGTQIGDVSGSGGNDLNLQSNSVTRINIEAEGRININDVLNLNPLSTAPNSGTEQDGDIYLHDTGSAYELRVWNGSSWQTL